MILTTTLCLLFVPPAPVLDVANMAPGFTVVINEGEVSLSDLLGDGNLIQCGEPANDYLLGRIRAMGLAGKQGCGPRVQVRSRYPGVSDCGFSLARKLW